MSPSERPKDDPQPGAESAEPTPVVLSEAEAAPILEKGEVLGGYRVRRGSNYTFLVHLDAGEGRYIRGIYKPRDGERPLYDFPMGTLYRREYAAFVLSRALGWPNVPLTLIREGPYGVGSMQLYMDCDPAITYFDLPSDRVETLQRFAVFDLLANNADRKAGHCLLGNDGRIWSIDHGLTLHPVFKVRTVMLELWGRPIPKPLLGDLARLLADLQAAGPTAAALRGVLAAQEVWALARRVEVALRNPVLPALDPYRNVPWPWL